MDGNLDQAAVGHTLKGETVLIAVVPCALPDALQAKMQPSIAAQSLV